MVEIDGYKYTFFTILKNRYGLSKGDFKFKIKELILLGYGYEEVKCKLKAEFPEMEKYCVNQINEMYKTIRYELDAEMPNSILETVYYRHQMVYDMLYREFEAINFTAGVRKAIGYKNALTGINKNETNIDIERTITHVENNFDFSRLTGDERKRLDEYLSKINVKPESKQLKESSYDFSS